MRAGEEYLTMLQTRTSPGTAKYLTVMVSVKSRIVKARRTVKLALSPYFSARLFCLFCCGKIRRRMFPEKLWSGITSWAHVRLSITIQTARRHRYRRCEFLD